MSTERSSVVQIPIPNWVSPFFSSLEINKCSEKDLQTNLSNVHVADLSFITTRLVLVNVKNVTCVSLSFEFEKALLHYSEYPPDANKGFDLGSA